MFTFPISFMGGIVETPPTLSYIGRYNKTPTTGSSITISNVGFGATGLNRRVVLAIEVIAQGALTLNSATIGGVSATIIQDASIASNFLTALVPTGTTGDVVLNFNTSQSYELDCNSYRIVSNSATVLDFSEVAAASAGYASISRSFSKNSALIASARFVDILDGANVTAIDFSGITEDDEYQWYYDTGKNLWGRGAVASKTVTAAYSGTVSATATPQNTYTSGKLYLISFK